MPLPVFPEMTLDVTWLNFELPLAPPVPIEMPPSPFPRGFVSGPNRVVPDGSVPILFAVTIVLLVMLPMTSTPNLVFALIVFPLMVLPVAPF